MTEQQSDQYVGVQTTAEPDRYEVTLEVRVAFTAKDPNVIRRVLDNEDGWRQQFYDLDEADTAEMLAYNCGVHELDVNRLDGWADVAPDAVDNIRCEWQRIEVLKNGERL